MNNTLRKWFIYWVTGNKNILYTNHQHAQCTTIVNNYAFQSDTRNAKFIINVEKLTHTPVTVVRNS